MAIVLAIGTWRQTMTIKIMGRYGQGEAEELDTANNENSAEYLIAEYRMAFGAGWHIWQEDDKDTDS